MYLAVAVSLSTLIVILAHHIICLVASASLLLTSSYAQDIAVCDREDTALADNLVILRQPRICSD